MTDQQARLDRVRALFAQASIIGEENWQQWYLWQAHNRNASSREHDEQFNRHWGRCQYWGAIQRDRQAGGSRLLRAMYPDPMASEVSA